MTDKLTQEQTACFKQFSDFLQVKTNESTTTKEINTFMKALGRNPTQAELSGMMKEADNDGDGKIDFLDFQALMHKKMKNTDPQEQLREFFKALDRDGNGLVSAAQVRSAMAHFDQNFNEFNEQQLRELILSYDEDKDGFINYQQFVRMMMQ